MSVLRTSTQVVVGIKQNSILWKKKSWYRWSVYAISILNFAINDNSEIS